MTKYKFDNVPNKEAISFLKNKKLEPAFSYKDVWQKEHAFAFNVAKATEIDILQDFKNAIDNAIATGQSYKDFASDLTPLLQKKGWWGKKDMLDPKTGEMISAQLGSPRRLKTIYKTNLKTARMAGKWERAERTKGTSPYLIYLLGSSKEHRREHLRFKGLILHIDDRFWNKHYPPNGWGCKCTVRQITQYEADSLGGVSKSPKIENVTYINDRTGKTYKIPKGVDPSFAHNAGKERAKGIDQAFSDKFGKLPENVANVVVKDIVQSNRFKMLQEGKIDGFVPVGVLPKKRAKILIDDDNRKETKEFKESFSTVFFSKQTAKKQLARHKELKSEDYEIVQSLLENGDMVHDRKQHLTFVGKNREGKEFKATVKRSNIGEYFLQTLHRLRDGQVETIKLKDKK